MSTPAEPVGRTARSKFAVARYKSVRVTTAAWKRARICAIELGIPVGEWLAQAIARKADLQQRAGGLSKQGARVATQAVVLGPTPTADEGEPS